jgi:beta-phosphoglucomutase-like phosphatase (HAD superfamily)
MPFGHLNKVGARFFASKATNVLHPSVRWANHYMNQIPEKHRIKVVQSGVEGTLTDPRRVITFRALSKVFSDLGLQFTPYAITDPLQIIEQQLFFTQNRAWKKKFNRDSTRADVEEVYKKFNDEIEKAMAEFSALAHTATIVPQFLQSQPESSSIPLALVSSCSRTTFEKVIAPHQRVLQVAASTTADEVSGETFARLESNMKKLALTHKDFQSCVFITDNCEDIEYARRHPSTPWIVGFSHRDTGDDAERRLLRKGAHVTLNLLADVPQAVVAASLALSLGKKPHLVDRLDLRVGATDTPEANLERNPRWLSP